ncbi:hypothetical protein COT48_00755 [Candidatus Woesearchaeota archaeon CG08_land_8_20_14_0_20_47_9]|nr:MAG: hypothetical protein AUJ69_02540 [Candidatus Woesearchaeota archaeon CG1_02_47_18]PIN72344.1 MAG: hypothetical protein COV22_03485 [Candidatus Woesearchaeota archaeon CG10_big_fil_rev_8_21_14_0_10_47_5]PIO04377.1 MAG: hypothetical protein COT48_00755 [Candidatus Woesearchaeota archaeon CG08_land_8_20_14_0_20_47_9]HII29822.1 archaeosortase/exosortase family protein [Candidatus Woesearchaeota archaeon]
MRGSSAFKGLVESAKELGKNSGLRQFVKKTVLLFMIFLALPILLYPFLNHMRYPSGRDPLPFMLVDLGNTAIFIAIAFFFLARKKLMELKTYRHNLHEALRAGALMLVSLTAYLMIRFFTYKHLEYAFAHRLLFVILIMASIVAVFSILIVLIFGREFICDFARGFKREIVISSILILLYYIVNVNIRKSWELLGRGITFIEYRLLRLTFGQAYMNITGNSYMLGTKGFTVSIGQLCSSVDSMALFLGLYILILCIDWRHINKLRMALIFLPGLITLYFVNIIRIYLLMVMGVIISPSFAVGLFHSNAGWTLFILHSIAFWSLFYPWVMPRSRGAGR